MLGYHKRELSPKVGGVLIMICHHFNQTTTLHADIVHKDLKSTLRVLYSIFGKYKSHFQQQQQQPHPSTTPTNTGTTSAV